jgi:hypothetical protein
VRKTAEKARSKAVKKVEKMAAKAAKAIAKSQKKKKNNVYDNDTNDDDNVGVRGNRGGGGGGGGGGNDGYGVVMLDTSDLEAVAAARLEHNRHWLARVKTFHTSATKRFVKAEKESVFLGIFL